MSAPYANLSADDYLHAAQALLPSGAAWPRDPNTILGKYTSAVANVAWLAHQMLAELFVIALDPAKTNTMLPAWEAAFGITARGSTAERRMNLEPVTADPGGFSRAHYVALAAAVGVDITVDDVVPAGLFTWELRALGTPDAVKPVLEAVINAHNRATCALTFVYSS